MTDERDLRAQYGDPAVDALRARISGGSSPEIDPVIFGRALAEAGIGVDAVQFLDAAAAAHMIARREVWTCPADGCGRALDDDAVTNRICPYCGADYRETGDEPVERVSYRIEGPLSRTVPWLIAVHGFNTLGPWQEEFSWRIANRFKHHAPVLIHKYGLIRFSVLVRWRHRQLARQLGRRIRQAVAHASANQVSDPPDMIVHSFGSQLFRLVLEMAEFADLKFGRVIVCGGIIQPDFAWRPFIEAGRVEAVLAHCGGKDRAVPFAQYFIPGSGPGARRGYADACVINVMDERFGHSSCFTEAALAANLERNGLWDRFLREPVSSFADPRQFAPAAWRAAPMPVRGLVRVIGVALLLGLTAFASWLAAHAIVGLENATSALVARLL